MQNEREKADTAAIQVFVRHAQRFGTDEVLSAAADKGLRISALVALQTELDTIDAQKRRRGERGPRLSAETRVNRLLGIEETDKEG